MVTSCHRNVPTVGKLRGREKEDRRGRETAASKSREASRRRKRTAVFILVRFCVLTFMEVRLCNKKAQRRKMRD